MVLKYQKGTRRQVTENFYSDDFDCQCEDPQCDVTRIDTELRKALDSLWKLAGPFHLREGYRCSPYNVEIGAPRFSEHVTGKAADIELISELPHEGFEIIANHVIQEKGGIFLFQDFVHVDFRGWKSRGSDGVGC